MAWTTEVAATCLGAVSRVWPSPVAEQTARLGGDPTSLEYHRAYTVEQFTRKVSYGLAVGALLPPLWGRDLLELGCGHGGITCYLASLGARRAVGIDINVANVEFGRWLAAEIEAASGGGRKLAVEFLRMDCAALEFPDQSFDFVLADNLFEHVPDPERVMREASRVLRAGGLLAVPAFSSILSKHGLHLKHGLRVPWANLLFSEPTIVRALQRQIPHRPELLDIYPGLRGTPTRVRDLRLHGDLNDLTYGEFRAIAGRAGLRIRQFQIFATPLGRVLRRLVPRVEASGLLDVLSTGASALLEKPGA